ncbi:type II restriction endonuclease subunit M [Cyanobium sp. LEGE 06143]|uniref:type II restriction endonuclease subunit M n=1 Tax=Cyanobium sp. LEGE 06143 TaxID=945727 RepID=UPI001880FB5C|nr:type II restriction endonuclease subunit M [Cyanobium sp. LEGE 06143]MBE9172120.1 type II restriction endonuclease subunit M [Cyanobium sp. LEGE 06143]
MKTIFIRAIEAALDDKAAVIREAIKAGEKSRFDADLATFSEVPRSPFAYWAGDAVRSCFVTQPRFGSEGRTVKQGLATADDFRFVRLATEIPMLSAPKRWFPFAKGGTFSRFYADVYLVVDWSNEGAQIKHNLNDAGRVRSNVWMLHDTAVNFFSHAGLTWPRRTQGGLSFRIMPRGCIFADKGPAAFVDNDFSDDLLALAAIANSRPFAALVEVQMAFGSYEVGVIQRTPVPELDQADTSQLSKFAQRIWSLKRLLDSRTENSHAFSLPALLQVSAVGLTSRAEDWAKQASTVQAELDSLSHEIDDHAYRLYGISAEDRLRIEQGFGIAPEADEAEGVDADDIEEESTEVDATPMVASLLSWSLGVAFGRFDVRLATGERPAPPEPEPFDPLPVCSPGMLTGDDGLPLSQPTAGYPLTFPADGLLVDDLGHPHDLISAVRSVFEVVFDDPDARWKETAELLGTSELRSWFASDFFRPHIKRYSKSRRKAPIYWQFATPSGSYSVWLYIRGATGDTLFRVLELVSQKLLHEESKHAALLQDAGPSPSPSQRRDLEQQESFLRELRALKAEVARVAPLWRPDLDDGVLLTFAPLWGLVPQLSSWQTECRNAWEKLAGEHFDWAHLAMHLWPERVVPKCQSDRSLAIAHGLEDTFWFEEQGGTWRQREVAVATIQQLIDERSSATVKAALQDLRSAPAPVGRSTRRTTRAPRSSTPRQPAAPAGPDPALLNQVQVAIAGVSEGASRADVLAATGISASQWTAAIRALLARGAVTQVGERRGARYHLSGGSTP